MKADSLAQAQKEAGGMGLGNSLAGSVSVLNSAAAAAADKASNWEVMSLSAMLLLLLLLLGTALDGPEAFRSSEAEDETAAAP